MYKNYNNSLGNMYMAPITLPPYLTGTSMPQAQQPAAQQNQPTQGWAERLMGWNPQNNYVEQAPAQASIAKQPLNYKPRPEGDPERVSGMAQRLMNWGQSNGGLGGAMSTLAGALLERKAGGLAERLQNWNDENEKQKRITDAEKQILGNQAIEKYFANPTAENLAQVNAYNPAFAQSMFGKTMDQAHDLNKTDLDYGYKGLLQRDSQNHAVGMQGNSQQHAMNMQQNTQQHASSMQQQAFRNSQANAYDSYLYGLENQAKQNAFTQQKATQDSVMGKMSKDLSAEDYANYAANPESYDVVSRGIYNPARWLGSKNYIRERDTPKAGNVQDGYVFLGGNPADPNSWRQK